MPKQLSLFPDRPQPHLGWKPEPMTAAEHTAQFENMRDGGRQRPIPSSPLFPGLTDPLPVPAPEPEPEAASKETKRRMRFLALDDPARPRNRVKSPP